MSFKVGTSFVPNPRKPVRIIRRAAAPGPDSGDARLRWLVRQTAAGRRAAFVELFDTVALPLSRDLRALMTEPGDVAAVLAATFVEVWWLARHHTHPDVDAGQWIRQIAARRVGEARRAAHLEPVGFGALASPAFAGLRRPACHVRGTGAGGTARPPRHALKCWMRGRCRRRAP